MHYFLGILCVLIASHAQLTRAADDRPVSLSGPYVKSEKRPGRYTLRVSPRALKSGKHHRMKVAAKHVERSISVVTFERDIFEGPSLIRKELYNVEQEHDSKETSMEAFVDIDIGSARVLEGENSAELVVTYDGEGITVKHTNEDKSPVRFDSSKVVRQGNNFSVVLTTERKDAVTPTNNMLVEAEQVNGHELVLFAVNDICDQDDDSTTILEGDILRSRWLPFWWWLPIDHFRTELEGDVCKKQAIYLHNVDLKKGRRLAVRYRVIKTNSDLFSDTPSPERMSRSIVVH